jgi:hypothetical protein
MNMDHAVRNSMYRAGRAAHTCQQSSQPALSHWPAGLRLSGIPGRLDGLIGCGGLAGLMALRRLIYGLRLAE